MKTMKRIGCYAVFVFAYALFSAVIVFLAEIWGCTSDSIVMRVLWFVCGYLFCCYLNKWVFPFLDEKFP